MPGLLLNIDVPALDPAIAFYTQALGLTLGRRFGNSAAELLGSDAPVYLLAKPAGSAIGPVPAATREYDRHWTPIHPDFVVDDLDGAVARALAAGAVQEGGTHDAPYGRLAMFADPFGHGFCLIQFSARGYDALLG